MGMARLRVDNRFADRLPSLVGQAKAQKGGGWKEEEEAWVAGTSRLSVDFEDSVSSCCSGTVRGGHVGGDGG